MRFLQLLIVNFFVNKLVEISIHLQLKNKK